jgi:hypothetical protein
MAEHSEGRILTVAGNAVFAIVLAVMIAFQLLLWRKSSMLIPYTKKIHPSLPTARLMNVI